MFRKIEIVIVNLTDFFRSLFADKQDPNSKNKGNKITDAETLGKFHEHLVCMRSAPTGQAEDNIKRR